METLNLKEKILNEEKLYENKLQQCLEELEQLIEDFKGRAKPGSRPGSLKRKASQYLGKGVGNKLSKSELRRLRAKANKMRTSGNKAERKRGIQLGRQVSFAFNMRKE